MNTSSSHFNTDTTAILSVAAGAKTGRKGRFSLMAATPPNSTPAVVFTALAGVAIVAVIFYSRKRKHPLSPQQWKSLFTEDGRLRDGGTKFLKRVRNGGVHPRIRAEVWPFLLGVYDFNSTKDERDAVKTQNRKQYEELRRQCTKLIKQSNENSKLNEIGEISYEGGDGSLAQDSRSSSSSSSSDDAASARETLSSQDKTPEAEYLLEGDDYVNVNNADASMPDADSSEAPEVIQTVHLDDVQEDDKPMKTTEDSAKGPEVIQTAPYDDVQEDNNSLRTTKDSVEGPEVIQTAPPGDDQKDNNPVKTTKEVSSPLQEKVPPKLPTNEDFSTWQRIIRLDALRANAEWMAHYPSQASVSDSIARQTAEAVGLEDYVFTHFFVYSSSTMVQSQQFSSGIEVATFVTSSGLLRKLWNVNDANIVSNVVGNNGLSWKVYKEQDTDVTIVAFETAPSNSANLQSESFSSTELKEKNFLHFQFLSTKANPLFSLNIAAVSLFFENHESLDQLKTEVNSSPKLIITGLALGGSIASLFTLLLLDGFDSRKKKPLCITFGSPLIGDKGLQKSISNSSSWNSCFLHVVSCNDPLPRKFITDHTSSYVPFGTFLVCYDTYSTCFENPDSVLAVLETSIHDGSQVFGSIEYGNIVERLHRKAICKDTANQVQAVNYSDSLQACIGLQLLALRSTPYMQQQQQEIDIITLVEKMERNFINQKRKQYDPSRKLNSMKIDLANFEWYKKDSKKRNIGYYDSCKIMNLRMDQDAVLWQKNLTIYWKKMVEESLMKPQKEGASLRTRWLFGGTTYRRMVEPLEIAQYYLNGGKDYVTRARSSHYKQLEDWLVEEAKAKTTTGSKNVTRENVESILTLDSCFWAYVEEALISCKKLVEKSSDIEKDEATRNLVEFENYVYGLLKEYAVSPEIFLGESSYMAWWNKYKKIKGGSYSSKLTYFMSNAHNYNVQYVGGTYKFD